ncbi:hypothetical protein [Allokutzneria sp. NRRL B-24872]|uniref:hypothetical protein n=1 Tax=Allokutzneria sp. NRRL B-24872 TaxID=1137961 RepID=UPI001FEE470E|nr:hypothetical protein [Allokutzneria sp. NRRL B-24872]
MSRLPEDVVDLIDALKPGEDVALIRDGSPIATITSTRGALEDALAEPGSPNEAADPQLTDYDDVTIVATAMKLSAAARASLSAELGADYIVLDMHKAPTTAEVLLVPPISPQLIGSLQARFPKARVIIAEIEDDVLGVSYEGPVRRLLDAGAETYLSSTTVPRLAKQLDHAITHRHQITGDTGGRLGIEPSQVRLLSE